jgi:CheY-like chemotaxis protein
LKPVDVPKFMNALISDLQTDAWDADVKLVLDASTMMAAPFDSDAGHRCLRMLLDALIRSARRDSAISVVTAYEASATTADAGHLQLTVTAAPTRQDSVDAALGALHRFARSNSGDLHVTCDASSWTCTLTLPAKRAEPDAPGRIAVVVDDDVDMQEFLTAVLESRGFKVVAVNDGFDALIVIDRYQPSVVLTDVLMPNMNGLDLVGRIKAVRKDLPVIVFTGYYDALVKKTAQLASLPDYILPKPMTQLQVLKALDSVLAPPT